MWPRHAALITALVLMGSATPAFGATAQVVGSTVQYVAAAGEQNELLADDHSGTLRLTESTNLTITAGSGCSTVNAHTVDCSGTSLDIATGDQNDLVDLGRQRSPGTTAPATVDLGAGDDTFNANSNASVTTPITVQGGDGNDTIFGGYGNDDIDGGPGDDSTLSGDYTDQNGTGTSKDTINGGTGNDRIFGGGGNDVLTGDAGTDAVFGGIGNDDIETLDGEVDTVACSGGSDTVNADAIDVLAADCTPPDADGDGLPDAWEINGVDLDGDGTVDLDLPAMGAKPDHKDAFMEIDAMAGHEIEQLAVDSVVASFANAPVSNPDGTTGIALHVDNGPSSTMDPRTGAVWGPRSEHDVLGHQDVLGSDAGGSYDWSAFDALKAAHFNDDRRPVFHYVISAHQYGNPTEFSSGLSRGIGASDLIISLGTCQPPGGSDCTFDAQTQAGTLMHEFGHNLGLKHGGTDDVNNKPNYLSVMNYSFQFSWLPKTDRSKVLDYARFGLPLDENALDENHGLGAAAGSAPAAFKTITHCPKGDVLWPVLDGPVDFNCNGTIDGTVAFDVSDDAKLTSLTAVDDWSRLVFTGGGIGSLGAPVPPATTPEDEPPVTQLLADRKLVDDAVATPAPPTVTPTTPAPPPIIAPVVKPVRCTLVPRSSVVALHGVARGRLILTARCDAAAKLTLRGTVTITHRAHHGAKRHSTVVTVKTSLPAKANIAVTIKLTVPRSVLSALTHRERTSASFRLQATSTGGVRTVTAKIARLKAKAKR